MWSKLTCLEVQQLSIILRIISLWSKVVNGQIKFLTPKFKTLLTVAFFKLCIPTSWYSSCGHKFSQIILNVPKSKGLISHQRTFYVFCQNLKKFFFLKFVCLLNFSNPPITELDPFYLLLNSTISVQLYNHAFNIKNNQVNKLILLIYL